MIEQFKTGMIHILVLILAVSVSFLITAFILFGADLEPVHNLIVGFE